MAADWHWTEEAERVGPCRLSDSPMFGLVGENSYGELLVPSWKRRNWWDRRLNLRRPTHWLPYLRSRLTRKLVWLDE